MRNTLRDKKYDDVCEFMKNTLGGEKFLSFDDEKTPKPYNNLYYS
jgi:hypothetical protein